MAALSVEDDVINVTGRKPALSMFDDQAALNIPWQPIKRSAPPIKPKWYEREGIADFLLASGATMANSQNFFGGLASGLQAGNQAMDERAERNKPRFEFLNNGRTLAKFDPHTGEYTYHEVDPVNKQLVDDDKRKSSLRREEADHEFGNTVKRDGTLHGYSLKEIEAQGENSKAVAHIGANASLTAAAMRAQTSENKSAMNNPLIKERVRRSEALYAKDFDAYLKAEETDMLLDNLSEVARNSKSIGSDAVTQLQRSLSSIMGVDFMGVKPGETHAIEGILRNLELVTAGQMAGQGQITENERKILREALPNIHKSPEAFRDVMEIVRKRNSNVKDRINGYQNAFMEAEADGRNLLYYDYIGQTYRAKDAERAAENPPAEREFKSGETTVTVHTRK